MAEEAAASEEEEAAGEEKAEAEAEAEGGELVRPTFSLKSLSNVPHFIVLPPPLDP